MINYQHHKLANGLQILHHHAPNTASSAVNLLYKVGSRNEEMHRTGLAHLFEHLMFEGSQNIPSFDGPLQMAGGENNAFTSNDITNYYITLPSANIETAFWLESDRMLGLDLSEEKLAIQKKVVIEEYNQRYTSQPYGDLFSLLRDQVYRVHPYRWPTIGKDMDHIREVSLPEVEAFFYRHYAPNNAILSVVSDIPFEEIVQLAEKWFGPIPERKIQNPEYPVEPEQNQATFNEVARRVPLHALVKAYPMSDHLSPRYYAADALSDILANGRSARLHQALVKKKSIFQNINAYITGDMDRGMLVVSGHVLPGISLAQANEAVEHQLFKLTEAAPDREEIQKIKNKFEAVQLIGTTHSLNKAMNLAYYQALGDAKEYNLQVDKFKALTASQLQEEAQKLFAPSNSNTLFYKSTLQPE
ncbi:MAG: M16 family metallopeptidase [Bacteroidota bacterium]